MPEGTIIAGLPALNGFGREFEPRVWSQVIFDGPSANAGAVSFEMEAAQQFAGDGVVGARRFGREKFGDQGGDFGGPLGMMVAARESGRPGLSMAGRASPKIFGVEFVEAGTSQTQFAGGGVLTDLAGAIAVEQMANERSRQSFDQLLFFIASKMTEGSGFFALKLAPAGACPAAFTAAGPAVCQASDGAQVASPQSPILR